MWVDVDGLEADMLAILQHRIKTLGPDGSGLGPYYTRQIEAGDVFNADDRMLLKLLATDFFEFDKIVEAGSGYGQLGLALAAFGREVHLVEVSRQRFACIQALQAGLALKYPSIATHATLVHGRWPRVPGNLDLSRCLLVAVDFVFTATEDEASTAIEALTWYGGALFDGSHFVSTRLSPQARAEFYDQLGYRGLSAPLHLPMHFNTRSSNFVFVSPRGSDFGRKRTRHTID